MQLGKIQSNIFKIYTFIFILIFIVYEKSAIFAINDDSVIERILSGRYSSQPSSIVSFMTLILGKFFSELYSFSSLNISWYGFFLLITNYFIGIGILKLGVKKRNSFDFLISTTVIILITPFNILTPTYTVTALLCCGIGVMGLVIILFGESRNLEFGFYLSLTAVGFLIRPEALVGMLAVLLPFSVIYLVANRKLIDRYKSLNYISIFSLTIAIIQIINYLIYEYHYNKSALVASYLDFQSVRHQVFYTPALLKMHQAVISRDVLGGIWTNIDFIIFRNWAYADFNVFNYENLLIGKNFVEGFLGLRGLLQSDPPVITQEIFKSIFGFSNLIMITLTLCIGLILYYKFKLMNLFYFFLITTSFFMSFYYMTATLRLPFRITFPYLVLLTLVLVFLQKISWNQELTRYTRHAFVGLVAIQLFLLQFNSEYGLLGIEKSNELKIQMAHSRNAELLESSDSGIFIGPISYLPVATQGAYFSNVEWSSGSRSLALDWSTFSPSWRLTARNLKLDSINVYNSLATQDNVYWISNSYLAEILNMYMNDRQIFRGKLCSVAKLTGDDQAEIFTFQAKETDC